MSSSTFSLSLRKVPVVGTPKTSPHNLERPALFREPMATCCRPRTRKGRGVGGVVERGRADEAMIMLGRRAGNRRRVVGHRRRQRPVDGWQRRPTGFDNMLAAGICGMRCQGGGLVKRQVGHAQFCYSEPYMALCFDPHDCCRGGPFVGHAGGDKISQVI